MIGGGNNTFIIDEAQNALCHSFGNEVGPFGEKVLIEIEEAGFDNGCNRVGVNFQRRRDIGSCLG